MYNQEVLKIKCPNCAAVLTVKRVPNIESKNVPCPICKQKSPFVNFQIVNLGGAEKTHVPGDSGANGRVWSNGPVSGEKTRLPDEGLAIGTLVMKSTGQRFCLTPGLNIVGRNAQSTSATVRINTGESKRMSREHLVINVERKPGQGFVHSVKLYKQQVNDTYINNERLTFGDIVVLRNGDLIRLPDVDLVFSIENGEETQH